MKFKEIQTEIGYPNGDALRQLWNGMFAGTPCPRPDEEVPQEAAIAMLRRVSVPYRNRPAQYSSNAAALLEKIEAQATAPAPQAEPAEPTPAPQAQQAGFKMPDITTLIERVSDYPAANLVGVASTAYGLYLIAGIVGLVAAFLYAVVIKKAVDASGNADSVRERDLAVWMVIGLEVFAAFVHFFWANAYFWQNQKMLPWQGTDNFASIPGNAAITLAALISGIGVYSIIQVINRAKDEAERREIEESIARMERQNRAQ